jgi:hypothetical protein
MDASVLSAPDFVLCGGLLKFYQSIVAAEEDITWNYVALFLFSTCYWNDQISHEELGGCPL